jgi:hypothetical protein
MASKSNQIHTVHRPNGWGNIKAGGSRPAKIYPTKADAQTAGRQTAINQQAEHIIHNLDGKISAKNSYGDDPRDVKG